jgi:hypothetical protein
VWGSRSNTIFNKYLGLEFGNTQITSLSVRRRYRDSNRKKGKVMFQSVGLAIERVIAQMGMPEILIEPPETTALVFSSPQFIVALLAGVMMAFGFQLLLTNFSIAFVASPNTEVNEDVENSDSLGSAIAKIETKLGLWMVLTVSLAGFAACFLAVKLSLLNSTALGAITGVVIWSAYFSLLVWLGSTAIGSLIGSLISTATSGLQGILGTATAALGANAAKSQAVSTAEEITAAVRRELTSGLDSDSIQKTLRGAIANLPVPLPNLNWENASSQFEKILNESGFKEIAEKGQLPNFDRQSFLNLVSQRTDFSPEQVERLVDRLEDAWKKVGSQPNSQSVWLDLLKSVTPEQVRSGELGKQIEQLTRDKSKSGLLQSGAQALLAAAAQRVDLSDLDLEKIYGQLQKLPGSISSLPFSVIRSDVENYLLSSPPWHLQRESIKKEFKDVIYDPEADPSALRSELEKLDRNFFIETLSRRDDFTPERAKEVADFLESIRTEVLDTVGAATSEAQSQGFRSRIENYLKSTGKEELNPEGIQRDFQQLLADPGAGVEALSDRLSQFDRDTLVQLLQQRQDLSPEEADKIVSQLESTREGVITQAKELRSQAKNKAAELLRQVEAYLKDTKLEELNPEGIKRDFGKLIEDPEAGFDALKTRLSQFDRQTLVALLRQRQDLSDEQIQQTLAQLESVRDNVLQAPQKLAGKAQEQYEQTTSTIADYLRRTNLEELDPQGIERDLQKLLDDPKAGASAWRDRLSHFDRETLVKLLSQQEGWDEERVNRTIDRLQESIRTIIRVPRRLAVRTQQQVSSFESSLEQYLQNTNKEELNPEGIKRDLEILLKNPRVGLENLGDRFSQIDRSTLVALLSQRKDISEEEAERIVGQIESARDSLLVPLQKAQQTAESAIANASEGVRNYLNSLERPELNYEGIQQDFGKLFDDPQMGLTALRDRLSQFDRETLVALLASRPDISQEDANRIIERVESARDGVLQRTERIQQEVQHRLNAVKQQTRQRVVETQKLAVGVAWWLFGTALTSLAASALGGALAVLS